MGKGDVPARGTKEPVDANTLESNGETPVNRPIGIRNDSSKKVMRPIAQLKCLYTNACNMGNKQKELEAMVQLENQDLIAITETRWDEYTTGTLERRATSFTGEIGREGRVVVLPSMLRSG